MCWKPAQTLSAAGACPVCGRKLTVGVLHRVELLADRPEGCQPDFAPSCEYLISLDEVLGAAVGVRPKSKRVRSIYDRLQGQVVSAQAVPLVALAGGGHRSAGRMRGCYNIGDLCDSVCASAYLCLMPFPPCKIMQRFLRLYARDPNS